MIIQLHSFLQLFFTVDPKKALVVQQEKTPTKKKKTQKSWTHKPDGFFRRGSHSATWYSGWIPILSLKRPLRIHRKVPWPWAVCWTVGWGWGRLIGTWVRIKVPDTFLGTIIYIYIFLQKGIFKRCTTANWTLQAPSLPREFKKTFGFTLSGCLFLFPLEVAYSQKPIVVFDFEDVCFQRWDMWSVLLEGILISQYVHANLGGGFKDVIFTPIWGRFPFWLILTNIFQRGWSHQLEMECIPTCSHRLVPSPISWTAGNFREQISKCMEIFRFRCFPITEWNPLRSMGLEPFLKLMILKNLETVQIHTTFQTYRRLKPIKVGTTKSTSSGGFPTPSPKRLPLFFSVCLSNWWCFTDFAIGNHRKSPWKSPAFGQLFVTQPPQKDKSLKHNNIIRTQKSQAPRSPKNHLACEQKIPSLICFTAPTLQLPKPSSICGNILQLWWNHGCVDLVGKPENGLEVVDGTTPTPWVVGRLKGTVLVFNEVGKKRPREWGGQHWVQFVWSC